MLITNSIKNGKAKTNLFYSVKLRIMEIPGEPKNIRANITVERGKEEIQLLRMKSENSQNIVIEID